MSYKGLVKHCSRLRQVIVNLLTGLLDIEKPSGLFYFEIFVTLIVGGIGALSGADQFTDLYQFYTQSIVIYLIMLGILLTLYSIFMLLYVPVMTSKTDMLLAERELNQEQKQQYYTQRDETRKRFTILINGITGNIVFVTIILFLLIVIFSSATRRPIVLFSQWFLLTGFLMIILTTAGQIKLLSMFAIRLKFPRH